MSRGADHDPVRRGDHDRSPVESALPLRESEFESADPTLEVLVGALWSPHASEVKGKPLAPSGLP